MFSLSLPEQTKMYYNIVVRYMKLPKQHLYGATLNFYAVGRVCINVILSSVIKSLNLL